MVQNSAVMTGATGFLGSHFLVNKVAQEFRCIHAIVRGKTTQAAQQRMTDAAMTAADSYPEGADFRLDPERVCAMVGDIEKPLCGLNADQIARLRESGADVFWHFAASLAFEDHKKEQIYAQNVIGVQNALQLARDIGVRRFVYVSTAYTIGKCFGHVDEALHAVEGPFNNYYEQTKCQAEHVVKTFCAEQGIACTILRPSIVIGPAVSKRTGGSTTGLYGFVREVVKLKAYPKGVLRQVRLHAQPEAEVNLMPVDYLMKDIHYLVKADFGGQDIYHLSATDSVSFEVVLNHMRQQLDLEELVIEESPFEPGSRIEKEFAKKTVFYSGYIKNTKKFTRGIPEQWSVTPLDVDAFIKNAIAELA